jgi:hypothetical protein
MNRVQPKSNGDTPSLYLLQKLEEKNQETKPIGKCPQLPRFVPAVAKDYV